MQGETPVDPIYKNPYVDENGSVYNIFLIKSDN